MKSIRTDLLRPEHRFSADEQLWIYNGLDCMLTFEVLEQTLPQLDNNTGGTYALSRNLQGPVLDMNMRGVLIDDTERKRAIDAYKMDIARLEQQLYAIIHDGVGHTSFKNSKVTKAWRSNDQVGNLLYDVLRLPEVRKRNSQGELTRTVNREALEKLQMHFIAQPIISHILCLRDIGKKVSVLETDIDPDGRFRTSYNIAGTTTGRFSSAFSDFGTGGNAQNIEERLRRVFIPDPGMKFANIDLEQADARNIGALCYEYLGDGKYLDAAESGDLHTAVSRLAVPNWPWTNDLRKDREIAERPYYRHHSLRHMCKVLGHGTNYLGTPFEMAKHTKIPTEAIKEFQEKSYFPSFPAIRALHDYIADELFERGYLITPHFGRKRWFFGYRSNKSDDRFRDTLKQGVAHMGQSMTADEMNHGMLWAWRLGIFQLLLQVHDSILIQYPGEKEDEIIPLVKSAMLVPLELRAGRRFVVPVDVKVGWNWAKTDPKKETFSDGNPFGLAKWPDDRQRTKS